MNRNIRIKTAAVMMVSLVLSGCAIHNLDNTFDETGPFINLEKYEFETTIGQKIDFSNITGYDDVDGLMPVYVVGDINYDQAGEYYPVLSCTDTSENETTVGIIVKVLPASEIPVDPSTDTETQEYVPVPSTCDKEDAEDLAYPCNVVLPSHLEEYLTIYPGESGKQSCEKTVLYQSGEGTCKVILANDGTFWGYGLTFAEQEEEE
ncbi:MAG: hypothetical protein IKE36_05610 [Solobacterium sp.]|nr:hypothetical protein [Solobacterium sp.]